MKKISRQARQVLKSIPSFRSVVGMCNLTTTAHLTHHAALLSDAQLAELPRMGVVLFDYDDLISHRVGFDSFALKVLGMDDVEIKHVAAGRLCALSPKMFDSLEEWVPIERHQRKQPHCTWADLSRYDRIACVGTMLSTLGAWEMLLERFGRLNPKQ